MIHRDRVVGINVALVAVLLAIALAPRGARAQVSPNGGEFQVNTFTLDFQYQPAVAFDAQGNFVVVWQSNGSDGSKRRGGPQEGGSGSHEKRPHHHWDHYVYAPHGTRAILACAICRQHFRSGPIP